MELEDVFVAFEKPVYVYFLRVVKDPKDAEDLTQETFFRACQAALRFRGESSIRTWLFGIAHRVLLEWFRGRRRVTLVDEFTDPEDPRASSPEQRVILENVLASLEPSDRELLVLVDVLGFTPAEAATALGIESGALRVRLHRARQRFKERLGT